MSGRRPFSELTKDFAAERRQRIEAKKAELRAAMPLLTHSRPTPATRPRQPTR